VTQEEIHFLEFMKKDLNHERIVDLPSHGQATVQCERDKYDLTRLKIEANNAKREYDVCVLDHNEEVSKIVQVKKNGRIFYSSHINDFKNV